MLSERSVQQTVLYCGHRGKAVIIIGHLVVKILDLKYTVFIRKSELNSDLKYIVFIRVRELSSDLNIKIL